MITFLPLDPGGLHRVAHLRRAAGQEDFVGDPAHMSADAGSDLYAVERGGQVIAMFRLDRSYAEHHDFARAGDLGLRGLLVDAGLQGHGLGQRILDTLPEMVRRRYPAVRRMVLTVNCRNAAARGAYLKAGWRDDGALYHGGRSGPQHVMTLDLA